MLKNNDVRSSWGVTIAAAAGLSMPDVVNFFTSFGSVIDGFIKLGQFGVVLATISYIVKKTGAIKRGRRGRPGPKGTRGDKGDAGESA